MSFAPADDSTGVETRDLASPPPESPLPHGGRTVATLAQARGALLSLPARRRTDPLWQSAAELPMQTAYRGQQDPIFDIESQLVRVFAADRLI